MVLGLGLLSSSCICKQCSSGHISLNLKCWYSTRTLGMSRSRVDDAEVRQDAEEEGRLAVAYVFGCVLLLIC